MQEQPRQPVRIAVATHHKTGTVYARSVFAAIAERENVPLFRLNHKASGLPEDCPEFVVLLYHATPHQILSLPEGTKVVHFIRDPRSLIVSAMLYHLDASEAWLQQPLRTAASGETYQGVLQGLRDEEDRLIFEMENASKVNITAMQGVYALPGIMHVRLEDLSHDRGLRTYFDMLSSLGFSGERLLSYLGIAVQNSLWAKGGSDPHSRTGVSATAIQRLRGRALIRYHELFGSLHEEMGYGSGSPAAS